MAVDFLAKLQLAAQKVNVNPNPNGLPGTQALDKLVDGLAMFALIGCAAAVVIGAAQWALGNRSNNYSHSSDGKSKVLYGLLGAFIVGAAAAIVNFFYDSGAAVR